MKKKVLGILAVASMSSMLLYQARASELVTDFPYSNGVQSFTAPQAGSYKVELWGAAGGDTYARKGGNGKKVEGVVQLTAGETVYIYTGGINGTNVLGGSYSGVTPAKGALGGGYCIKAV